MRVTLGRIFQCEEFKRRHGGDTHEDEEVPMVGKISTALALRRHEPFNVTTG